MRFHTKPPARTPLPGSASQSDTRLTNRSSPYCAVMSSSIMSRIILMTTARFRATNHFRSNHTPAEIGRRQPLPCDLDGKTRHREPDRDIVHADPVIALGSDAVVAGHDQERAHREGVALAGRDHRRRKRQNAQRQFGAGLDHQILLLGTTFGEDVKVKTAGKMLSPRFQDRNGFVLFGLIDAACSAFSMLSEITLA